MWRGHRLRLFWDPGIGMWRAVRGPYRIVTCRDWDQAYDVLLAIANRERIAKCRQAFING